ncbi:MAG: hypothetical protein WD294_13895 [Phycisphaeraceae bacterium]
MRRRRRRKPVNPSAPARWLTLTTIALQAATLLLFWWYPQEPPVRGTLWQALWARANMPPFYPLMGLIVVGPPATYLAWSLRGRHRRWLATAWLIFLPWIVIGHGRRVLVMLSVWWKFG